jgi:hypothetical protein
VAYYGALLVLFSGVAQADVVVVQAGINSFSVACPSGYVLVSNSVSFDCVDTNGNVPTTQAAPAVNLPPYSCQQDGIKLENALRHQTPKGS